MAAADKKLSIEARKAAVEKEFAQAVAKARAVGMSKEEIIQIVHIMLED